MLGEKDVVEDVDVAIVGGGPAGCYVAFRLASADLSGTRLAEWARARSDGKLKVRLYERSDRVGGRVHSIFRKDLMPDVAIELGAEGFYEPPAPNGSTPPPYPGHVHVAALVELFKLATTPFEPGSVLNPYYTRGKRFTASAVMPPTNTDPSAVPYDVTWSEGLSLGNILGYAFNRIYPGATTKSASEWRELRKTATFKGDPRGELLYKLRIGDLLPKVLSPEAFAFLWDTTPLRGRITIANAADTMAELICNDFTTLTPVCMPKEGYQAIENGLAERFGLQNIAFRSCLQEIWPNDDGSLDLRFEGRPGVVRARSVVLALPRTALEALSGSPVFQGERAQQFRDDLPAVQPVPALVQWGIYPYPWWRAAGVTAGPSFTDLRIRETWPRQTQGEQPGAKDQNDLSSMLLMAFRDGEQIRQYLAAQSFRPSEASCDEPSCLLGDAVNAAFATDRGDLMKLYGVSYIPPAEAYISKIWQAPPFGGAYHVWLPECESGAIGKRMLNPVRGVSLHVVGEAYSQNQGWVEGALETAEALLETHFALQPPPWLNRTQATVGR
ncbi:FAD-dependent oxidoreductase [Polyangium sp. 6x1]|uniref:flavin monoamine oxidase family protein n=1 Tax=Polyangium sp. 6x1 TaxID=3042689 RepID=UPI002482A536|nr:FAD-dependent oxidoreductase [Polyangium sp. 6x1]MDI1449283.1 FAD-dependent oxidoreductase [Polyangium sp. 6x1]